MKKRATKITILFLFIFTLHGKTQNSAVEAWPSLSAAKQYQKVVENFWKVVFGMEKKRFR